MKTAKHLFFLVCSISAMFLMYSCSKDETTDNPDPNTPPTVLKHWEIPLSAMFEVPAPSGRTDSGTAVLDLMSDNSLRYSINITNLAAGDSLIMAHLHAGDPVTSGPVILDLAASFVNNSAADTITNLRQTLVDSLNNNQSIYLNVHSTQLPDGVARGQLDKNIVYAADIALTGGDVVPPTTTSATGNAYLRLTSDNILYSNTSVNNLDANDTLSTAAIYQGAAGATGALFQDLVASAAEFGTTMADTLSAELANGLRNDPLYINVYSINQATNGLIRGQIR